MADLLEKLKDNLARFRAEREKISKNADLTEVAKRRQIETLSGQTLEAMTRTARALVFEWESEQRRALETIRKARADAGAAWDYQRLAYLAGSARSQLALARTPNEIEALYARAAGSGDPYLARAFAEAGVEVLAERTGQANGREAMAYHSLARRMQGDAEAFVETPAVKQAEAQAAGIVDRVMTGRDVLRAVADEFGLSSRSRMFSGAGDAAKHPINQLLARVKVQRQAMPEGKHAGKFVTSVEILPAEPEKG